MPTPHRETANLEAFRELSALSVRDRLNQISGELTAVELAYVEATVINWCGMDLAQMSFFDCMRWWALAGHRPDSVDTVTFTFKLACGQTGFAKAIFSDVASYPNFAYSFKTPVTKISRHGSTVKVTTVQGETYTAKQLVSTIPWALLDTITFEPPLPSDKQRCLEDIPRGNATKVYVEVNGAEWDAWQFISPASDLSGAIQYLANAGCTPSGNARLVFFSLRDGKSKEMSPEKDPEAAMASIRKVNPELDIKRLVSAYLACERRY